MLRAVIVAAGDLDNLPGEVQVVANTLSAAGWLVRLCIGAGASRAGLLAAAGEGDVDLAWFGCHGSAEGFALSDGVWPPSQLGTWLRNVNACECVLNSCYSIEHVEAIQRTGGDVGVACSIAPAGVDDVLAWQVAIYLVRAYAQIGDMREAVRRASGMGDLQYRYIPAGGVSLGEGRRRMPGDRIEEQLALLLRALYGEDKNKVPGLVQRVDEIQQTLHVMALERQQWRDDTERRLHALEGVKPIVISERGLWISVIVVVSTMSLLLALILVFNGRFG